MSSENMFEDQNWQHSGNYGNFDDLVTKEAKKIFSRFSLALFLYLAISYAVIFAIDIILSLVLGVTIGPEAAEEILFNPVYQIIISTLPMYVVSFPFLCLFVKGMPSRKRLKRKLPLLELFYTFLVAEAFMMVGNLIGQSLNSSISSIFGIEIENSTADLITSAPIWLIFILVVICAPIVEELIFRKLMIDKLSRYGDLVAIITSAVAFGFFHGNFYQFFYASFLGLLLGYLYCKSGNIKYTIIFHMLINFLGSVAVMPLMEYEEILLTGSVPETGAALREFIIAIMAMTSYAVIQYTMVISGIVVFINAIKYRRISIKPNQEITIPRGKTPSAVLGNVGTILFLVLSAIIFAVNMFLG